VVVPNRFNLNIELVDPAPFILRVPKPTPEKEKVLIKVAR
jgi:hypothetical protein